MFIRRLLFGFILLSCFILTGCLNPKEKNTPQLPDTKEENLPIIPVLIGCSKEYLED